jgi:DNA-directed RNA polymerase omega subunit
MNNEYLAKAKEKISDPKELIVVAMKRANQLALGEKPMILVKKKRKDLDGKEITVNEDKYLNIALLEIAEGLIGVKRPGEEVEEFEETDALEGLDNMSID